jgi:DNA-binding transcriptional ArsR family regulator
MPANVSRQDRPEESIAKFLSLIGQPARIQILWVMGEQEVCVSHLEAVLGLRQATISQHLMVLRKTGLVTPRRDGRNIYYHLAQPEVVTVIQHAAQVADIRSKEFDLLRDRPVLNCHCPQCYPKTDFVLS